MSQKAPAVLSIDTKFNDGGVIISFGTSDLLLNLKPGQELAIEINGVRIYTLSHGVKEEG